MLAAKPNLVLAACPASASARRIGSSPPPIDLIALARLSAAQSANEPKPVLQHQLSHVRPARRTVEVERFCIQHHDAADRLLERRAAARPIQCAARLLGAANPCPTAYPACSTGDLPTKTSPNERLVGSTVTVNLLTATTPKLTDFKGRLSANLVEVATDRSPRILATTLALMAQADTK
jgi:hypothetical protein